MRPTAYKPTFASALRQVLPNLRGFSSSRPAASNAVPPESPSYIRLPGIPQSSEAKPPRVRGHLPVPRVIFPRPEGNRKIQPEYIRKTSPTSTKFRKDHSEEQKWKAAMADNRRANLRDGLDALWRRRMENDRSRYARANRTFRKHNEAGAALEREDDFLTRPTVLKSMLETTVHPDPDRFSRADRSRARMLNREASKREARRDALMELYISASGFIVHEADLKSTIEETFSDDYYRTKKDGLHRHGVTENVWGTYGKPSSIANMMELTTGMSTKVMDFDETEHDRSVKRAKRIAEDLTGGKMA